MNILKITKSSIILSALLIHSPLVLAQTEANPGESAATTTTTQPTKTLNTTSDAKAPEVKAETQPIGTTAPSRYATVEGGFYLSNGADASARFLEYDDTRTGILLNSFGKYTYGNGYHFDFDFKNIARLDQSYVMNGGKYNNYKYGFWYKNIYHKLSNNAKTFYDGVGSQTLTYGGTTTASTNYTPLWSLDPSTWNTFDYTTTKSDLGVKYEYTPHSPFYAGLSLSRVAKKGLVPKSGVAGVNLSCTGASCSGTSYTAPMAGNPTEFPIELNEQTVNVGLDTSYRTDDYALALSGDSSVFTSPTFADWRSPWVATQDVTQHSTIAPNNNTTSVALQGTVYNMPLASTLSIRARMVQTKSKFDLIENMWSSATSGAPSYSYDALTVNQNTFNGNVTHNSMAANWRGDLLGVDFDLFYRNLQRKDNSDVISYASDGAASTNSDRLFSNTRQTYGLDLSKKLGAHTRGKLGYEYGKVTRDNREDAATGIDRKFYVGVKNTDWDYLNVNVVYDHLDRQADFEFWNTANPIAVQNFTRFFDVTNKKSDSVKLEFSSTPLENWDIMLGGKQTVDTYPGTEVGLQDALRSNVYIDTSYDIPDVLKVTVFGDTEVSNRHGRHYKGSGDPVNGPMTTANFIWDEQWKTSTRWYGVKFNIPIIEDTLGSEFGITKEESFGNVNFSYPKGGGPAVKALDIPNMGNYKKTTITAKLDGKFKKNFRASLIGLVETLDGDDLPVNNYQYALNGTNKYIILSGYGADISFKNAYAIKTVVAYDF